MSILLVVLAFGAASVSHASESVYGNTNFTGASVKVDDDDYRPAKHLWTVGMGAGVGVSQLISEDRPGRSSGVRDSQIQLNVGGLVDRMIVEQFSVEGGISLGCQVLGSGPQGNTTFSARYLDIPALARVNFTKQFSVGAGGFATIPIDGLQGLSEARKLGATDLGLMASARLLIPASRYTDWVVQVNVARGLVHLGDAGEDPNHIRNISSLVGMAARF